MSEWLGLVAEAEKPMNEARMLAELAKLPDAELMRASKITDPLGADVFYSGRTVVLLLAAERERCAKLCDGKADDALRAGIPVSGPFRTLARDIRGA